MTVQRKSRKSKTGSEGGKQEGTSTLSAWSVF